MKQINNGFDGKYYLCVDGKVYDKEKDRFLTAYNGYIYTLKNKDNKYIKISLKTLYKMVYGAEWCVDSIEDIDGEEWREISGTDGRYYISSKGRVKSYVGYNAIILKKFFDKRGYAKVTIVQNGERVCRMVSNLVGGAFLLEQSGAGYGWELHHKDGNPQNDDINNLVYLSKEEHREVHRKMRKEVREKD